MMNLAARPGIPRKGDFSCSERESVAVGFPRMPVTIEPEPTEPEREAILAAVAAGGAAGLSAWESAALAEGVEEELDP